MKGNTKGNNNNNRKNNNNNNNNKSQNFTKMLDNKDPKNKNNNNQGKEKDTKEYNKSLVTDEIKVVNTNKNDAKKEEIKPETKSDVKIETKDEVKEETKLDQQVSAVDNIELSPKVDAELKALKNKTFNPEDFGIDMWLDTKSLRIDEDTQRGLITSQVEKIIKEFNPKSFGRITVSKRDDGYYVVNGQHRWVACRKIGIPKVPCIVLENEFKEEKDKKKQDAITFLEINQNSQAVRAIDKYRIGVSAQIDSWLRVQEVIEENGLRAGTTVNSVNCLACIYRYINTSNNLDTVNTKKKQVSKAIKVLNNTVGVAHITHISLQAMCIIIREYVDTNITTVDKLINKFNRVDMGNMITSAVTLKNMGTSKNVVTGLAFSLVTQYNNKCKTESEKLPTDRITL